MEEMIREEIGKISELKERVLFKDIVEQIFLSLYETNREMYQTLEHRVMDELFFDINRYGVWDFSLHLTLSGKKDCCWLCEAIWEK